MIMEATRYAHWQDGQTWLGCMDHCPDYVTQSQSNEEHRC